MSDTKDDPISEQKISTATQEEKDGLPTEEFNKLLGSIGTMAPLVRSIFGNTSECSPSARKREALLLALKPYLSQTRCEAIDYLIRIGRIGDAIRTLQ